MLHDECHVSQYTFYVIFFINICIIKISRLSGSLNNIIVICIEYNFVFNYAIIVVSTL